MLLLAADTTTAVASVAVCRESETLCETSVLCGRTHTRRLIELVERTLAEAQTPLDDIELLAISRGPGSFTGVRVGVAAWKGLSVATGVRLAGVDALDALARASGVTDGVLCVAVDARMKEVFGAAYRFCGGRRERLTPPCVGSIEALAAALPPGPVIFTGDGVAIYRDRIQAALPEARFSPDCVRMPRASAVAAEALETVRSGGAASPEPVYLRKSQAELAREGETG